MMIKARTNKKMAPKQTLHHRPRENMQNVDVEFEGP